MMLFIVLALFVLSGIDSAFFAPRREAARRVRHAPHVVAQRRPSRPVAGVQPVWQSRCPRTSAAGGRGR